MALSKLSFEFVDQSRSCVPSKVSHSTFPSPRIPLNTSHRPIDISLFRKLISVLDEVVAPCGHHLDHAMFDLADTDRAQLTTDRNHRFEQEWAIVEFALLICFTKFAFTIDPLPMSIGSRVAGSTGAEKALKFSETERDLLSFWVEREWE